MHCISAVLHCKGKLACNVLCVYCCICCVWVCDVSVAKLATPTDCSVHNRNVPFMFIGKCIFVLYVSVDPCECIHAFSLFPSMLILL